MKKLLLSLALLLSLSATVKATETTFTLADLWKYTDKVTESQITNLPPKAEGDVKNSIDFKEEGLTITSSPVSITFTAGENPNNGPIYYNTNGNRTLRIYKNNTFTVTSTEDLSEIHFISANGSFAISETTATKNITASTGAFSGTKSEAIWKSSEAGTKTITFTVGSTASTVQLSSIVVNPETAPAPETVKVSSVKEAIAQTTDTPVIVDFALTVGFVNGRNIFAADAAGDFIQVYGSNSYKVGDVIPAGWEANYVLYGGSTPEFAPTGTLPEATEGSFTAKEVAAADITTALVNNVVLVKNVVFAEPTPATRSNFTGKVSETELSFRNNYTLESVPAGTYNVTIVVTIYNNAPSLYVVNYTPAGSSSISDINIDENAPVEYFNLQGIRVANPENGLYIRRQGNTVSKVIIR